MKQASIIIVIYKLKKFQHVILLVDSFGWNRTVHVTCTVLLHQSKEDGETTGQYGTIPAAGTLRHAWRNLVGCTALDGDVAAPASNATRAVFRSERNLF